MELAAAAKSQRTAMNVKMLKQNAVGASLARSAFARKLKSISGEDFGVDCPNLLEDERRMYALPELEKVGEDAGGCLLYTSPSPRD